MVEHGARELLFLSRSAGAGPRDDALAAELRSMGCKVRLVPGDVCALKDVRRAVDEAARPLKGVVQMSIVLRDENLSKMTFAEWKAATEPKVKGTWNLHEATAGADLDFMVLFSSLSGVIGNPGQANYASGNTLLDAFAQWRNGLGLAASVVDIGAVEDVGFIAETQGLIGRMKTTGFKGVTEQELLDAMAVAMLARSRPPKPAKQEKKEEHSQPEPQAAHAHANTFVLGLGSSIPISSSANRAVWRRDRRMAAYHNAAGGGADGSASASNETLKSFLAGARVDPAVLKTAETAKLLALEIGRKLFDLLLKPKEELNTSWSLVDLGPDSLVPLELRAWWKQVFAFDITVLEMLGMGSLDALGQHAADGLMKLAAENGEKNGS